MPITNPEFQFSNSNGYTFGSNARTVTMSGSYAGLGFSGTNITATMGTNGLQLSVAAPGGGAAVNFSAGTTSNNLQTIVFSNSNGVSFGLNGSTVTASAAAAAGGAALKGSGTYTQNTGTVEFANSNGITFGLSNNGTMTASHNGLTSQSNQALSAGNGSFAFQTATFADSNGISFSTGTQGIYGTVKTDYLTSQSNQALSGANGSFTFQTASFANSNGVSFSTGTQGMYASHNGITSQTNQTEGYYALGNTTGQSSSSTWDARSVSFAAQGIVSIGNSAGSGLVISATQSNQAASASNGSFAFQTLNFSNANNVTFGTSAGSIITASVAAPGAAAENNWFNLAGNTTGNTTASGSTILLSAGNNVTLSGTNNSVIRIDAGGGGFTADVVAPYKDYIASVGQVGNNTVRFDPVIMPNFIWRSAGHFISCTNVSNSSGSFSLSMWMGIYTRTGGTLSIEASMSGSTAFTMSGTLGSWASYSGQRNFTISGAATTITEGQKWVAFMSKTSSAAGGNNMTISNLVVSQSAQPWAIPFGVQLGVNTHQEVLGRGMYSLTTAALPASLGFTDISGTASQFKYPPIIQLFATSY